MSNSLAVAKYKKPEPRSTKAPPPLQEKAPKVVTCKALLAKVAPKQEIFPFCILTMYAPSPLRENSPDPVQYCVLLSDEVGVSVGKIVLVVGGTVGGVVGVVEKVLVGIIVVLVTGTTLQTNSSSATMPVPITDKEPDDMHLNGPKLWVAIILFDIITSLTLPSHMRPLLGAEEVVIIISKYPLPMNALAPSPTQDVRIEKSLPIGNVSSTKLLQLLNSSPITS